MSNQWYDVNTLQWVDNDDYQWGFAEGGATYSGLGNIWTDENYVYVATSSGLDIVSLETEQRVSFATVSDGITCVWADDSVIYVGTSDEGVKTLAKTEIGPAEVSFFMNYYLYTPDLYSNDVNYIHGNNNRVLIATRLGLNVYHKAVDFVYGCETDTEVYKCFATPNNNYFYYTTVGDSLHYKKDPSGGWNTPDRTYTTGSGFLGMATCITDFYVTEHTSVSGNFNTLFIATDVGVFVYDEGTSEYALYTTVS